MQPDPGLLFSHLLTGALLIIGGGAIPESVDQAFVWRLANHPPERTVVILAAAAAEPQRTSQAIFDRLQAASVNPQRIVVGDSDTKRLIEQLRSACAVWICGGRQSRLAKAYPGDEVAAELRALLQRDGTIAGTSAGAAIMTKVMFSGDGKGPQLAAGWHLLPGAIVDPHFWQRDRADRADRLRSAVALHPDRFGVGIDEATGVLVQGRELMVLGRGSVTIMVAGNATRSATEMVLRTGDRADLQQLRRAAYARSIGMQPGIPTGPSPSCESGALVIVGGGGMPQAIVDRFIELAGGKSARIVVLPTAMPRYQAIKAEIPGFLRQADVTEVTLLPASTPQEIEGPKFQNALATATGVWFDGGRQWRFVDAYEQTNAVKLFHEVLRRGGVVGGTSAGATILGEYLVRGHPLGNQIMMAEGYERGFALFPGTAIDQHFSQRRRHADLIPVIALHPQMLGIGLDEATALIVQGTQAKVVGRGAVYFLTGRHAANVAADTDNPASAYRVVTSGSTIDLTEVNGN